MIDETDARTQGDAAGIDAGSALRGVLTTLVDRWWLVAVCAVVVMGAALAYSATRSDVYEAEARILYGAASLTGAALNVNQQLTDPERDAATNIDVAGSGEIAVAVRRELRLREPLDEIRAGLEISVDGNANVLVFTYRAGAPEEARRLAQEFADQYREFRSSAVAQSADEQIAEYRRQLAALPSDAPERGTLQDDLNRLRSISALAASDSQLIERAAAPRSPVSPRPFRDALLGLLAGLVLGVLLALVLDALDRRVKTVEEFERAYRMRALASIPQLSFSATSREDRAVGFEPYRVLRNAIGFVELSRELNAIMVTSAMPAEGKSTVSLNLARAIALSGQRVILVECDLRRPSLLRHLGLTDAGGGLTTALVGRRRLEELLVPVTPGLPHLSLLPSGPLPPNAAELLRSSRMRSVLAELTADGTRVILDAPPLLPVADAQGLLDHPQVDGAVVVARAYQTTRDEARRARAVIDQHRLQPLGIVVTGLREETAYSYYGAGSQDPSGTGEPPPVVTEVQGVARG